MSPLDPDLVERVLLDAVDVPRGDRERWLDEHCVGQPELRAEVASLLGVHDAAGPGALQPPTFAGSLFDVVTADRTGETIGGFRLTARLGEGGMGVVYRAEREGEFAQQVAVKLIGAPLRHPDTLRRFRIERQALASLHHPHIVTLLDGGITGDGQAYLVMEYVDGVPLTEYCRAHALPLRARLELFRRVCGAVQYAHEHLVVHRDLKAGNILVTRDGVPKVLDFGVAKLLDLPGAAVEATGTVIGRPLTLDCASPEQLRGGEVTTASDVYALGVLLYEVLAGRRPYETAAKPLDEVLSIVLDETPVRPSRALGAGDPAVPYPARAIRGDLDAITLMAMAKDPARRYGSPSALARDLAEHEASRPIVAREPSLGYLARVLARRHRAAVAAVLVSVVALVAAVGVSVWQTNRALRERERAEQRFDDVRQLAHTLIFPVYDAVRPLAGSTSARELIVSSALSYLERLAADAGDRPDLVIEVAEAYQRIGAVQGLPSGGNRGDRDAAIASYTKALALLDGVIRTPGSSHANAALIDGARVRVSLAQVLRAEGRGAEAVPVLQEAARLAEAAVTAMPGDVLARRTLGSVYFTQALGERGEAALAIWQQAAAVFDELLAERPDDGDAQRNAALVHKYIGGNLADRSDTAAAFSHYQRALELDLKRAAVEPDNATVQMDLAIDYGNLGQVHDAEGRFEAEVEDYQRSVEIRRRLADADPQDVYAQARLAFGLARLGRAHHHVGDLAQALTHVRESIRIGEASAQMAIDRPRLVEALRIEARIHQDAGRMAAACRSVARMHQLANSAPASSPLIVRALEHVTDEIPECAVPGSSRGQ